MAFDFRARVRGDDLQRFPQSRYGNNRRPQNFGSADNIAQDCPERRCVCSRGQRQADLIDVALPVLRMDRVEKSLLR
jgi:hypothetical protein